MKNLTLSLAQIKVANSSPEENLAKAETYIHQATSQGSSLIVFPEMWTTGFNWKYLKKNAQNHHDVIDEVSKLASKHRIWINGTMPTASQSGGIYNTSLLFSPEGRVHASYNKIHLFNILPENKHLQPGDQLVITEAPWGKTGLSICYDLRFPEVFREYALEGVCLVTLPAAVPYPRIEHWKILTRARAIENQMFMVCVNQVGVEKTTPQESLTYFGCSAVFDPWGETVLECPQDEECLKTITIDLNKVIEIRHKMSVLKDVRPEAYKKIKNFD